MHNVLNDILAFIVRRDDVSHVALLTNQLHLWPDYHGNRCPIPDPNLKGMVRFSLIHYGLYYIVLYLHLVN